MLNDSEIRKILDVSGLLTYKYIPGYYTVSWSYKSYIIRLRANSNGEWERISVEDENSVIKYTWLIKYLYPQIKLKSNPFNPTNYIIQVSSIGK